MFNFGQSTNLFIIKLCMTDVGGFRSSFCGSFIWQRFLEFVKNLFWFFLCNWRSHLIRNIFYCGHCIFQNMPAICFLFSPTIRLMETMEKIKIEVVFTPGKANKLRLNYPALNDTLKEIILMLLEVILELNWVCCQLWVIFSLGSAWSRTVLKWACSVVGITLVTCPSFVHVLKF